MSERSLRMTVVGARGDRRVRLFHEAVAQLGWRMDLVTYNEVLDDPDRLRRALEQADAVRIESPGNEPDLERALIARGAGEPDDELPHRISARAARRLPVEPGRIRFTRQWYLGFRAVLQSIAAAIRDGGRASLMSCPDEIALMFDKPRCSERLRAAGVPIAPGLGLVRSMDELEARLVTWETRRVFLKPRHGSSASGVLAYGTSRGRARVVTSVELARSGSTCCLFNSLEVRAYHDPADIRALVDGLGRDGLWVERWLPKASALGSVFDLRVVVIGGEAQHTIMRLSRTPLTNLHLGNRRASPTLLPEPLRARGLPRMLQAAAAAARTVPRSHHVGVDVMVTPGAGRVAVLELNAFGDLLPGTLHRGQSTYEAELAALAA